MPNGKNKSFCTIDHANKLTEQQRSNPNRAARRRLELQRSWAMDNESPGVQPADSPKRKPD